jgi:hypothetical protein
MMEPDLIRVTTFDSDAEHAFSRQEIQAVLPEGARLIETPAPFYYVCTDGLLLFFNYWCGPQDVRGGHLELPGRNLSFSVHAGQFTLLQALARFGFARPQEAA